MRFWDSSAVVPLVIEEQAASPVDSAYGSGEMVVWWATVVEATSAVARRERAGSLDAGQAARSMTVLGELASSWREVPPTDAVRRFAQRLLRVHSLRAADSLQLAAAFAAGEDDPSSVEFVCLDAQLRRAAALEGFRLLPAQVQE